MSDADQFTGIQAFLLLFSGLFVGPLFDIGYFRPLLISGNVLVVVGMMLTRSACTAIPVAYHHGLISRSICKDYWQIVIAQGIVVGLGFGCIFVPSIAILPQYFAKRLQFANGVAAVGSGLGEYH